MATTPAYPTILTNANWQKEKGVIAKLSAKETGIGAALDKAKAKFDKIDWTKFDCNVVTGHGTGVDSPADVDKKYEEVRKYYTEVVEPLRSELSAVGTLATKVAGDFKGIKLIPKSSREHVEKIGTEAGNFMTLVKDNSPYFVAVKKAFDDKKHMLSEMIKGINEIALKAVANIKSGIIGLTQKLPDTKVAAGEKTGAFTTLRTGPLRGLSAALDRHPKKTLGTWNKDNFVKFTVDSYDSKDVKDIPGKLKAILSAVGELEPKLA